MMRRLFPLLAAFSLLGLAYSVATPIFETPDELQHYAVVNYVAHNWGFPPLGKTAEYYWDQQALQAPLFYWLAATATFWIDTSDLSRQAVLQPKANIGDATLPGKKNAFRHGPEQSFPYHGTTLAVHIARWISVLLGAGTLALTYGIAGLTIRNLETGPEASCDPQNWFSLLSAALVAFIPQFIFIHAASSNDSAITFTATLTLFCLVWLARTGVTLRRAALLGVVIGLMALSKLTGTVLAVVAFGLLLLIGRRLSFVAVALGAFALVAGWWYIRNQIVYGDPLALSTFLHSVGGNLDLPSFSLSSLWGQFRLMRFSTWGLFGHISVLMQPEWIYRVFDLAALAGAVGFGAAVVHGLWVAFKKSGGLNGLKAYLVQHSALGIVLLWLAAVLAIGARWFLAAGIQGRLIFPGVAAGAVAWVYGLAYWIRQIPYFEKRANSPQAISLGLALPLAIFATAVVPAYLLPAYSPPPVVSALPTAVAPANINFADQIALRGYVIGRDQNLLRLTFYWETLQTPAADYTVAVRLVRPDGSFWLDYVNYPGMGTSWPTTWQPGELRRDDYEFDLNRFSAEPAPLRLIVGFYDSRVHDMIPLSNWDDIREKGWATLTELRLAGNE